MSITIVWDNPEKTVLRYDIAGKWTWADFWQAQKTIFTMMDAAEAEEICTIAHFLEGKVGIPADTMAQIRSHVDFEGHPKAGLTVVVGAGFVLKNALGMFRRAYVTLSGQPLDFAYADTLEEARHLLERQNAERKT